MSSFEAECYSFTQMNAQAVLGVVFSMALKSYLKSAYTMLIGKILLSLYIDIGDASYYRRASKYLFR